MALTKEKKQAVISEVSDLLSNSKMTVMATYRGTSVKAMQVLRRSAADNGTRVKVVKNRLVLQALKQTESLKNIDTGVFTGMLLYAFNPADEVAPAQAIAKFAKIQPNITFVGAITAEGTLLSADEVKELADLPSKDQLIANVINTLQTPLNDVINGLAGDLPNVLSALGAKAKS